MKTVEKLKLQRVMQEIEEEEKDAKEKRLKVLADARKKKVRGVVFSRLYWKKDDAPGESTSTFTFHIS